MIRNKTPLSAILTLCSKNILNISSKKYGIINESSNIKINNCLISGGQISGAAAIGFNFNNSNLTLDNNKLSGKILYENILSLNSQIHNTLTKNNFIIQKGSIYNYSNYIIPSVSSTFLLNDKDQIFNELNIPNDIDIISKKEFILKYYNEYPECKDECGDGIGFIKNENFDLNFSANYLTNNKFAYWSSIYKGRFTADSKITLNTAEEFYNLFKSIPRNLNGYKLTINSNFANWIDNLLINNFYNGYIIFNTLFVKFDGLILNNNNCEIEFNTNIMPINNNLNDNKHIIFNCNKWKANYYNDKIRKYVLKGDNNIIILNSKTKIDYIFNILNLNYDSYGNYIELKNKSIDNYEEYIKRLDLNNNGNMIFDKSNGLLLNEKNSLSNHSHKNFPDKNTIYLNEFRINDVRPKIYNDNSCIGSIIGWLESNNIPIGYYKCDGSEIPVNNFNPNDIYYNALLAHLMNANNTIKLPNLSSYTINGQTLIYIIKYNNNFEHIV